MFKRVLIANRGEIAVRIIRACQEMDLETVAVYSTADQDSLHARIADRSICIDHHHLKKLSNISNISQLLK